MNKKGALNFTLKFALLACMIVFVIILLSFSLFRVLERRNNDTSTIVSGKIDKPTLIIDAGHGGEDAGAIADDGTLEKDLNLQIANLVRVLCELNGTSVVMTREDDRLLYDHYNDLDDYTGQKKLYDLKNRVKIAKEYDSPVFLSIHMNKFSQQKYSGVQVYYSRNDKASEILARKIQSSTKLYLQPSNNRQVKGAGSEIFVLDSLDCPAVLVECGFLSNQAELENLKNSDYQASVALILFHSCVNVAIS